ncbi:hypothetical protein NS263_15805 [Curtobacterium oceanosedimentum]|uniref:tRNA(Ile)-lysidine/2-thiocytidine synthase N-terminal domain-containing protein n=1 Tax=Curtobacterium oceanosedimentum TaxID=465820 RepID=A0ABR5S274_9MICO|nr:hypothetical protein NS263_15805 [Curtobacterium oceanosedimentum]
MDPAVAATRLAVRTLLSQARDEGLLQPGDLVTVALSGGADSLALAAPRDRHTAPRLLPVTYTNLPLPTI